MNWAGSPFGHPWMTVHIYVVDDLMIDTGLRHMQNEVIGIAGTGKVQKTLLTHHHEDHSGNAAALKDTFGISVYGHPATVSKMKSDFRILPYQHYMWGKTVPLEMAVVPEMTGNDEFQTQGHSHTRALQRSRGLL